LSASKTIHLRNNLIDARGFTALSGFAAKDSSGIKYFVYPTSEGRIKISNIDLFGISKIEINALSNGQEVTYMVGVNLDSEIGINVGNIGITKMNFGNNKNSTTGTINLKKVTDGKKHDVYLTFAASAEIGQRPLLKSIKFISE
jgi:cytochrome c